MSSKIDVQRRDFLKFLGVSTISLSKIGVLSGLTSCSTKVIGSPNLPSYKDDVILRDGLSYELLISWGDKINSKEVFGFNNDYINIHSLGLNEYIMWVNHEYVHPGFVSGFERSKENIDKERSQTGGSLIHIKKGSKQQKWQLVADSKYNKGVRADTKIPFANGVKVKGSNNAIGTLANCAGGKTPWGTFLTCEENYNMAYGEVDRHTGKISHRRSSLNWSKIYPHPPEHYGWVVEVDPYTGNAQKHTNLGRFSHESATCIISKSKKVVVYSGDDKTDEHLYKFVSDTSNDFKTGTLYVANTQKGKWLPLDLEKSPVLKKHFKTQLDVVTYSREASKILGATPLNRPEDIEIHPTTGDVYIALTNNKKKGDFHGSILKLSENQNDHSSLTFSSETFLLGGDLSKLSCPDNLAFDQKGNLWISTDISGRSIGKEPYQAFGNNGLFVVPTSGSEAGNVIQVASAPVEAEFTGICFSDDYKELFLSVQHPGEKSKDIKNPSSTWPTGVMPKPSVIVIKGDLLDRLTQA